MGGEIFRVLEGAVPECVEHPQFFEGFFILNVVPIPNGLDAGSKPDCISDLESDIGLSVVTSATTLRVERRALQTLQKMICPGMLKSFYVIQR